LESICKWRSCSARNTSEVSDCSLVGLRATRSSLYCREGAGSIAASKVSFTSPFRRLSWRRLTFSLVAIRSWIEPGMKPEESSVSSTWRVWSLRRVTPLQVYLSPASKCSRFDGSFRPICRLLIVDFVAVLLMKHFPYAIGSVLAVIEFCNVSGWPQKFHRYFRYLCEYRNSLSLHSNRL
jgi:hypothetical protein